MRERALMSTISASLAALGGGPNRVAAHFATSLTAGARVAFNRATSALTLGVSTSGSFHTKRRRGGVERRQLKLKGVEGGD